MKTAICLILTLFGLALHSQASSIQTTATREVAPNAITCSSVTVTTVAADITGNTTVSSTTAGVTRLDLFPITSTNVFVGDLSTITATIGNGASTLGMPVPGLPTSLGFPAGYAPTTIILNPTQKFFAIAPVNGGALGVCKTR